MHTAQALVVMHDKGSWLASQGPQCAPTQRRCTVRDNAAAHSKLSLLVRLCCFRVEEGKEAPSTGFPRWVPLPTIAPDDAPIPNAGLVRKDWCLCIRAWNHCPSAQPHWSALCLCFPTTHAHDASLTCGAAHDAHVHSSVQPYSRLSYVFVFQPLTRTRCATCGCPTRDAREHLSAQLYFGLPCVCVFQPLTCTWCGTCGLWVQRRLPLPSWPWEAWAQPPLSQPASSSGRISWT